MLDKESFHSMTKYLNKFIDNKNIFHISELFSKERLLPHINEKTWKTITNKFIKNGAPYPAANILTMEHFSNFSHKELWENYLEPESKHQLVKEMAENLGYVNRKKGVLYCLDIGILLEEDDANFDDYNEVYDKEYGYYDENQIAYQEKDLEAAKAYASKYVEEGVDMTYAIITNQGICDYEEPFDDGLIEGFTYQPEDVIFSIAKIHGNVVINFISPEVLTLTK